MGWLNSDKEGIKASMNLSRQVRPAPQEELVEKGTFVGTLANARKVVPRELSAKGSETIGREEPEEKVREYLSEKGHLVTETRL